MAQPEGRPYVFLPPTRYDYLRKLRSKGCWKARKGNNPLNDFDRQFRSLLGHAGIQEAEFHDVRRTCLSRWLENGLSEFDVMQMAGHSKFETTHGFYLAVRRDLLDRTRQASQRSLKAISVAKLLPTPTKRWKLESPCPKPVEK